MLKMAVNVEKQTLRMNDGYSIPLLGLGTWQSKHGEAHAATKTAIECGYRHIDTAMAYQNEKEIGEAIEELIQNKTITREEIFITTKLAGPYMGVEHVKPAFEESLRKLRIDYVDLFLIHTPIGMKFAGYDNPWALGPDKKIHFEPHDLIQCYKELEKLVDEGLVRSIGVSNFNSEQIDRIIKNCRIKPVTNQVECHAYFPQNELNAFLKERDIFITAYSPIASPGRPKRLRKPGEAIPLLEAKTVTEMAVRYSKSPAQICLRNLIQRGMVVIPKSTNPKRIKENSEIFDFELSDADMKTMAALNNGIRLFDGSTYKVSELYENPFAIPF